MSHRTRLAGLALAGLLCSSIAAAADRALIVGVGNFADPAVTPLPGIAIDIAAMQDIAEMLGYPAGNIETLFDEKATLAGVREAFERLRHGSQPEDRALIYFSTRGTRVPDIDYDEPGDHADEALLLYDANSHSQNSDMPLGGLLIDDDFARLLQHLPSRNVLVIVDACFSGTATRAFNLPTRDAFPGAAAQAKAYVYPGMPGAARGNIIDELVGAKPMQTKGTSGELNYVALGAVHDGEQALATAQGSLFTLGLHETVKAAATEHRNLSPEDLRAAGADYIAASVAEARRYQPQLTGHPLNRGKDLAVVPATPAEGAVWRSLTATAHAANPLELQLNKLRFCDQDLLEVTVEIPADGYLNIVGVDNADAATVLFPNALHPDNHVQAGSLRLPGADMDVEWFAMPPYGKALLAAFWSKTPANFYEMGHILRDLDGQPIPFRTLSLRAQQAARAWGTRTRSHDRLFAAAVEAEVLPASHCP